MKTSLVNFILLFILSFDFTQQYGLFPTSTFPVIFYGPLFFLLAIYGLLSLKSDTSQNKSLIQKGQLVVFVLIVLLTFGRTFYSAISLRHQLGESYPVHDNPIQIEEGVKFLLQGKNPYTENYHQTPMGRWHNWIENPALFHFVTLPFYIFFSAFVSLFANGIMGFFDERMVHLLSLFLVFYLFWKLIKSFENKILLFILFIFNPLFIHFFIEGRNDIFVFSLLFLSLYLLSKNLFWWSSFILACAFASKQSAWMILPFYFSYIYFKTDVKVSLFLRLKKVLVATLPFFIGIIFFFVPFLVWDAKSFVDDIYRYPSGSLPTSYPIKGLGFSEILVWMKIIAERTSYYPFMWWQLAFGMPVLVYLLRELSKRKTISFLIFGYSIFLLIFWYFSRFFMENYAGFISMLFLMAMAFLEKEKEN